MGLCISFSSMIWVIAYAIYFMLTTPGSLRERWSIATSPVSDRLHSKKLGKSASEHTAVTSPMTIEEIPLNLAEDCETQNVA